MKKKENKYTYLMKNAGILAICNFSSKILVFFLVPLYTSVLSTSEYGTYDLISTTIQLVMPIICANIYEGVTRYLMDKSINQRKVVSIGTKFVSIGIIIFGLFVLYNHIFNIWKTLSLYALPSFLLFTFTLLDQYAIQMAKGFEKISVMGVAGVIGTVTTVICNILFLITFKLGLTGFFGAYILGQAIPAFYILYKINFTKYVSFEIDKDLQKEMLIYSFPLVLNTLGWWANNVSDRYVVTLMCGIAANGIYSVSYKIPSILNVIQSIFTQSWQISAVKEYGKRDTKKFYGNVILVINIGICAICMLLILMSKFLAHFLYAKDFFAAWQYVPFLLVSVTLNCASGILGPILSAKKDSKSMGVSALFGASTNVALNFLLIYFIGVQGAAVATAISSFIIFFFRRRAVGDGISLNFKFYLSWIIICIQAICMIYFELYALQIVLIIIFCFIYRTELKNCFDRGNALIKNK